MKFCLKYVNTSEKMYKADELSIKYQRTEKLIKFMEKFEGKRFILRLESPLEKDDITLLNAIKITYPQWQFAVALPAYNEEYFEMLKEKEISFFVNSPCLTWDMLHALLVAGVCDINITGPLGFELDKVKQVVGKKAAIRAIANIAFAPYDISLHIKERKYKSPWYTNFFIRPEDLYLYEPYLDILEFEEIEHQDSFFHFYAESHRFLGKFNQLIYNLDALTDNKTVIGLFGERRISCNRECLSGGFCRRCIDMNDISIKTSPKAIQKIKETFSKVKQLEKEETKDQKFLLKFIKKYDIIYIERKNKEN